MLHIMKNTSEIILAYDAKQRQTIDRVFDEELLKSIPNSDGDHPKSAWTALVELKSRLVTELGLRR